MTNVNAGAADPDTSLVLITGMSGSGRNTAAAVLEEMGWYVADNLPPELIMRMVELSFEADSPVERLAIVTDVRSRAFAGSLGEVLDGCTNRRPADADLPRRRRRHADRPLRLRAAHAPAGIRHPDAGHPARAACSGSRRCPTSCSTLEDVGPRSAARLEVHFSIPRRAASDHPVLRLQARRPRDADLARSTSGSCPTCTDCGGCARRGTDQPVSEFVLSQDDAPRWLDTVEQLISVILPGYRREGKNHMSIAIGCTGGHHRSVAMSEALGRRLGEFNGIDVNVIHRDIERD